MPHERDQFKPRELTKPQLELIAKQPHAQTVPGWREQTMFDFSECPHTQEHLIEVDGPHGVWGMMVCVNCGTQTQKECPHVHCEWYEDGKVLVCSNCGIDGT